MTWTITMCATVPLIVDPDLVRSLETITAIWSGIDAGGAELSPLCVVHVDPHVRLAVLSANPFIADGAGPPLSELLFHH